MKTVRETLTELAEAGDLTTLRAIKAEATDWRMLVLAGIAVKQAVRKLERSGLDTAAELS